ncbi:hypothetical protein [Nonomuraea sp. bgisy101]|uniref:hypothetical protein n=1 Tax=Nonomuraea sp. bgisy101 TaxID=3413784 RepID=UPI003D71F19A
MKKQERAIGAELFARNSHSVRLTRLGEQLRDDLRHLHQGLTQSLERARQAARGVTGTLCLGMIPGNVHARGNGRRPGHLATRRGARPHRGTCPVHRPASPGRRH